MNQYAKKMKKVRHKAGFSQSGFDKLLGLPFNTTNGVENAKHNSISAPFSTLLDLCEHPEVIHRLRIMRGMDVDENQCKLCKYFDTCTTKGGPNCQSFKLKKVIFTRRQP